MKLKYTWIGVIALVFIGGFTISPPGLLAHEGTHVTITITDGGYEPKEVFVLEDTIVTWVNEGEKERWPASNSHPTHTLYPGSGIEKCGSENQEHIFDTCRGLKQGESWEFHFGEKGVWKYHDHLHPGEGGVVHVFETEEERVAAEKGEIEGWWKQFFEGIGRWIRGIGEWLGIISLAEKLSAEEFRALSENEREETLRSFAEKDSAGAWKYLKEVALDEHGAQVLSAHELSHIVGNALYEEHGIEGIGICDPAFAFGCYHGVAEKFLADKGPERIMEAVETCKNTFPDEEDFLQYGSCAHGLGHGLLTWHTLDLHAALDSCNAAPENARGFCYDGVFMEFSFSASPLQYPKENPWVFCTELPEEYHIACARYQPELMQSILKLTKKQIADECVRAPTPTLQEHCATKLGFEAAWENKERVEGAAETCTSLFSGLARAQCITGAAREAVFQLFPHWREKSIVLCNALSGAERERCVTSREKAIQEYDR